MGGLEKKIMSVLKTLLAVVIVFVAGMVLFAYSGVYNIAADEPHWSATRWLLETTRSQSIARRDDSVNVPADLADTARIRRGVQSYGAMCQICHLGPGVKPTPLHEGLNPKPPQLVKEVAHHAPENLFWIVKHGIKMSGMPAWGATHGDEELWDVVAFLKQMEQMTPQQYEQLTRDAGKSTHAH